MAVDPYTLSIGVFIALLALKSLFGRAQGQTALEKLASRLGALSFVVSSAGWLMMWFTESAIWSSAQRTCTSRASIELKGKVYHSCSYLVHRYEAGEHIFYGGLVAIAICIGVGWIAKREA